MSFYRFTRITIVIIADILQKNIGTTRPTVAGYPLTQTHTFIHTTIQNFIYEHSSYTKLLASN